MTVTIEINDNDAELFSRWCSVCRTINESLRLLNEVPMEDANLDQDVIYNSKELELLKHPLDRLHQAVRAQIWIHSAKLLSEAAQMRKGAEDKEA